MIDDKGDGPAAGVAARPDRDLFGAMLYAGGFAAASALVYLFNALIGRRLDAIDFATFVALLSALLALTGPTTALFGGGAMSSARTGEIPRMPWRNACVALAMLFLVVGLAPVGMTGRALAWFGLAAVLLMAVSWFRGLLIGLGKLGFTGVTMVIEGVARISFALLLVSRGYRVAGASAGLALGVFTGLLVTSVGLPRTSDGEPHPVRPEVWLSIFGLFFLGIVQFADVVAVRIAGGPHVGDYAAASSLARIALYAQLPAAAYAIRRTAMVGAARAVRRVLLLSLAPGIVTLLVLEVFPRELLSITYGGHYDTATGLLRVLAIAMFMAGAATVLINMMLGAGRTAWVWSLSLVSVAGAAAMVVVASSAAVTAFVMTGAQATVLVVAWVHFSRLLAMSKGGGGGVLIFNWRDTRHPQGGGSEVFVEEIARRLAAEDRSVTIFCADHAGTPRDEVRDGVRYLRRGSWRTVYVWAAAYHLLGRFGPHDVVVDVQNAIPFFTPLFCGRPVVVLVHHVHREQWGMLFGPRVARAGWWVESRVAPVVYRHASYVAVSQATKADLQDLGIDGSRIAVVHNGSPHPRERLRVAKTEHPSIVYLGRLVPHKRIELLIEAVGDLRPEFPGLRARVVGHGAWEPHLARAIQERGLQGVVTLEGFVDGATKRRVLAESWVLALPSVQEGWGLVVVEAAAEAVPTVAFAVGGLTESIVDGVTGVLATDQAGFVSGLRELLGSPASRTRMGEAARARAATFTWEAATLAFEGALSKAQAAAGLDRSVDEATRGAGEMAFEPGAV